MGGSRVYSDQELVDLLKSGDKSAFTELFLRYNRLLVVQAHKLLNDSDEARDLVQEIFTTIWDNRENLTVKTNFAGFLYTTVRNKIFDMMLHKKVESKYVQSIQEYIAKGEDQTDHLLRTKELQAIIEKEISYLPPKMREVFELSRKQHLSHKQIAEQLDITEKTVKNQITNALRILKTRLGIFVYLFFIFHK